jgi:hypothetical protein
MKESRYSRLSRKFDPTTPEEFTPVKCNQCFKVIIRITASTLVLISGITPLLHRVYIFKLPFNPLFPDPLVAQWALAMITAPLLLIIAACFRPYRIFYLLPAFTFARFVFWYFTPGEDIGATFIIAYSIISALLYALQVILVNSVFKRPQREKKGVLYQALDLDLKAPIQALTGFIVSDIKEKYIEEERRPEYVADYLKKFEEVSK